MKTKYHIRHIGLWWYVMEGQVARDYFATYHAALKRKKELETRDDKKNKVLAWSS